MAVTLKLIAEKAGVDVSVVSRVINNKARENRISSERAKEILSISKELGYMPNAHAQSISSGKFNCVALISSVHRERSYLPSRFTDAISSNLEQQGKHLLLAKIPDSTSNDIASVPLIFRTLASDGMIVNYTHNMPKELVSIINNNDRCVVWLNTKRPFDSVYSDSFKAAKKATERLIGLGHKRIAYIDIYHPIQQPETHFSAFDRHRGYQEAMKQAGLCPVRCSPSQPIYPGEQADKFLYSILNRKDKPTAVITYWSHTMAAIYKAANILNIKIPDELSIITFASESSVELGLNASAMIEPEYATGCAAVDLYMQKEASGKHLPSKVLDYEFCDLATCKKPS